MGMGSLRRERVVILLGFLVVLFLGYVEADGKPGRILLESGGNASESALALRTARVDPLDGLKKYRGGFNLTNEHYWSSTIFTGKFGYFIAAAWLVVGLIYAATLIIYTFCKKRRYERKNFIHLKRRSNLHVFFAVMLTFLTIIASGVALGGSSRLHSRAMKVKNIVIEAANNATGTIYTVTKAVGTLQNDSQLNLNVEDSSHLLTTLNKLYSDAVRIERKAERTLHLVSKGLSILNVVTIFTVSLNLVAILALLISGPLRLHRIFKILVILCWVLTFLLWAYFGLYYFFGKFAGDLCMALDEYQQKPENSTLSSILSCSGGNSAQMVLHDVGGRIYDLIEELNSNITSIKPSFSGLEYICNPFSGPPEYNYQSDNCSSDTMRIAEAPLIIKRFACSGNGSESCKPGEFIPAQFYDKLELYASSMQDILDSYPGLESLVNCQLVKDAFSAILYRHCRPLKKYVHISWGSLAAVSTIMVVLILNWISEAHRWSKYQPSDGSVKPTLTDGLDVDAAETHAEHLEDKIEP
ncbi:hypothetical protein AXF42_Ash011179 [Apostasia shenzhenica]|uniref:Uncharacterized protein n=1 Tax=Apostasia shenzhenica TaxID=1088818 RepID=A0A2I0AL11_9ASPA|nr:hypothetical protein AXF42_Ash011179 [Apostasia shenzhenica]